MGRGSGGDDYRVDLFDQVVYPASQSVAIGLGQALGAGEVHIGDRQGLHSGESGQDGGVGGTNSASSDDAEPHECETFQSGVRGAAS